MCRLAVGHKTASLMPVVMEENKRMCCLTFACETAWWWLGADGRELTWVGDNASVSRLLRADGSWVVWGEGGGGGGATSSPSRVCVRDEVVVGSRHLPL